MTTSEERVDALVDQAALAREQGDQLRATRLANEARQLVKGEYRRAGQLMAVLSYDGQTGPYQEGSGTSDPRSAS
jgi:hypothetical protein